jgi:hypothetical protein
MTKSHGGTGQDPDDAKIDTVCHVVAIVGYDHLPSCFIIASLCVSL